MTAQNNVCSVTTARTITQLAYLIHTCHHFRVNLYISLAPFSVKKSLHNYCCPYLEFFLEEEKEECQKYIQ